MEINNKPLEYTGTIVSVGERIEYGSNGFAKRDVILCPDVNAKYPKMLQIFLTTSKQEDRTNLILPEDKGTVCKVTAYIETRKWTTRAGDISGYTTEAVAFKVEWPEGRKDTQQIEEVAAIPEPNDELPF